MERASRTVDDPRGFGASRTSGRGSEPGGHGGRRAAAEPDPLEQLVADESVRRAFLVVLESFRRSSASRPADQELTRLSELLAPDVVMTADSGGRMNAARRPLVGAGEVGRFLHGLVQLATRHGAAFDLEPALVNGDPDFVVRIGSDRPRDPKVAVYTFTMDNGRVAAIYAVLAPDKLSRLPGRPAVEPVSTPRPS